MGCTSGKHQPSEPVAAVPPNTLLGSSGQAAVKPAQSASQATPAPPPTTQSGVPPESEAPAEQAKSLSAEPAEGDQCAKGNQACAEAEDAAASAERTAGDATVATSAAPDVNVSEGQKDETADAPRTDATEQSGMPTTTEAPTKQVASLTTEVGEEGRGAETSEEHMEPTGMLGCAEHAEANVAKASGAALALREAEGTELGLSETAAPSPQPLDVASMEGKANQEVPSATLEQEAARTDEVEEQAAECPDPGADVQQEPAADIDDVPAARAVRPSMGLWGVCCRGPESTEPEITLRGSEPEAESQ